MLLIEVFDYVGNGVRYNDTLNPKLYDDNDHLLPEVREALLKAAQNFVEDLDIPNLDIQDIVITGSGANYNWTPYSDIDLHLITDIDVMKDPDLAAKYFNAKKNLWNNKHAVNIRGVDVEVYVEDDDEVNESLGRYSVMHDKWVKKPTYSKPSFDKATVNRKSQFIMNIIDSFLSNPNTTLDDLLDIKDKIWKMRKAALEKGGEFSNDNLVFKVLRNTGYLGRLLNAITAKEDKEMSVQ